MGALALVIRKTLRLSARRTYVTVSSVPYEKILIERRSKSIEGSAWRTFPINSAGNIPASRASTTPK